MILQISLWSGIVALYLGIAGAVGIFSRQAIAEKRGGRDRLLAATYSVALFLPATALVLAMVESPLQIMFIAIAVAAVWASYSQPSWIPEFVWQRTFAHRYLAGVMALAALWGINQAFEGSPAAPLLIAISAIAAAAASSGTVLKTPSIDVG